MPRSEKPLIDKTLVLERFDGKGGWTYVRVPEIKKDKSKPFGLVKVRGTIDDYEFRKYHLMPMGNGKFFLPVKAEIRKRIKKQEGDKVRVILFPDNEPLEVPEEMLECLREEPEALKFFRTLTESEQKHYVQWIYSAKKEDTKVRRLAASLDRLSRRLRLYEPG